jgi:uncharacterized protein YndB with AHSA1/START domain
MANTNIIAEPGKPEVVITSLLDLPLESVFKAYTDPKLIPRWWGPEKYTTVVARLEPRFGGTWRFIQTDDKGNSYAFKGVFHEVLPPQRIVQTFEFEEIPGHVSLQTAVFEELDGKTKVTSKVMYQSVQDRDSDIASGMESGVVEGNERLEKLMETRRRDIPVWWLNPAPFGRLHP